jgi:hypothetical protein
VLEKRMAAVYEIDGRLLIRTVHSCGGAGIDDEGISVVDGFPGVEAREFGEAVQAALALCREVPMPDSWPSTPDYARPFLEHSPRRYRSYRAWQRSARHASVTAAAESIRVERRHPDLGEAAGAHAVQSSRRRVDLRSGHTPECRVSHHRTGPHDSVGGAAAARRLTATRTSPSPTRNHA